MRLLFVLLLLFEILAAYCLIAEEAGENYSRDPYLIAIGKDGCVTEYYRQ